jgi:hypothetical protein
MAMVAAAAERLDNISGRLALMEGRLNALENPVKYDHVADVPYWGRDVIERLTEQGKLVGDENGKLGISGDLLRTLVIADRILKGSD